MKTVNSLCIFSLLVLSVLSSPAQSARLKSWINDEGIREYGKTIPPEHAQKSHQEIGSQGLVRDKKDRAKTTEEIAEAKRLAVIAAEKQKLKDQQAREDKMLLDTFVSVSDIEAGRNDKIAVIESDIALANKRNEKTQQDLDKRIQAAANAERAGKTPNEALLDDIKLLRERIESNNAFITAKQQEQEQVKSAADTDINRFKSLKGL